MTPRMAVNVFAELQLARIKAIQPYQPTPRPVIQVRPSRRFVSATEVRTLRLARHQQLMLGWN